jgi:hypothetical protein
MLEVSEGVQCTPRTMIERGNFEPLSPKKILILKILILKTLKTLILTSRSITAGLIFKSSHVGTEFAVLIRRKGNRCYVYRKF